MIHVVFDRPHAKIKVFDGQGTWRYTYTAAGDAWGHASSVYGFESWCPPGHYLLGLPQFFDTPIPSEGYGQIPILDIDDNRMNSLVNAGKATLDENGSYTIGGISLPTWQLANYGRTEIMIHGGGSNAPHPYAEFQMLCKTDGCTRMYNHEWKLLANYVKPNQASNTIVFSIIGDPVVLAC